MILICKEKYKRGAYLLLLTYLPQQKILHLLPQLEPDGVETLFVFEMFGHVKLCYFQYILKEITKEKYFMAYLIKTVLFIMSPNYYHS